MLNQARLLVCCFVLLISPLAALAGCIPFTEAAQHVGETRCIKGKVLSVSDDAGSTRLSFCHDSQSCGFVALVKDSSGETDLINQLEGKTIKIRGLLTESNGSVGMTLRNTSQLFNQEIDTPSLMKGFDVEERGHYSAGTSHAPKTKAATATKKQPATIPIDVPADSDDFPSR